MPCKDNLKKVSFNKKMYIAVLLLLISMKRKTENKTIAKKVKLNFTAHPMGWGY